MGIPNTFYLDDILMSDYNVYIGSEDNNIFYTEDLIPDNKSYIESVVGMNGVYYFGKNISERKISIKCYIDGVSESEKRDLQKILYIKTAKKLIFDSEPFKYLWIISNERVDFRYLMYQDGLYRGFFIFNGLACDPMWYSYYNSLESDDGSSYYSIFNNSDLLPSDIPNSILTSITTSAYSFNLYNAGSYNAKTIVAIDGNALDINIENTTTDENFTLSSLATGFSTGTITINGKTGQILDSVILTSIVSTASSLMTNLFSGSFIELEPGSNSLTITASVTDSTHLAILSHGLATGDAFINSTRASTLINVVKSTDNLLTCSAVTGQIVGDTIKKFDKVSAATASTGTTSTNITITGHLMTTGDYIVNITRSSAIRVVAIADANNLTVTAVTGQTIGDIINRYDYIGDDLCEGLSISAKFLYNHTFL